MLFKLLSSSLLLYFFSFGAVLSQTSQRYENLAIVLDGSRSMTLHRFSDGTLYWIATKRLTNGVLRGLAKMDSRSVALVQYGANQPEVGTCNTELMNPLGLAAPSTIDRMIGAVDRLKANGNTSLAEGIKMAWSQLDRTGGMIVIITDLERDNCQGDPCATVAKLRASRSDSLPPIEIAYVVSVGPLGYSFIKGFSQCAGAELILADKAIDLPSIVERILKPLIPKPPSEARLQYEILFQGSVPRELKSRAPSIPARLSSNDLLNKGETISLTDDHVGVSLSGANFVGVPSFKVMLAPERTSKVHNYLTPPLFQLDLQPEMRLDEAIWDFTHLETGKHYYFKGAKVQQHLEPGSYKISVWSGDYYATILEKAPWNSVIQRTLSPAS